MGDYETTAYQKDEPVSDVNLKNIITFLWRGFVKFWWLPIELALIIGAIFWYRGYESYSPEYQTSAIYMVESGTAAYSSEYRNATTTTQVVSTFSYILNSTSLKEMVLEELEMSNMPAIISASAMSGTNMMTLTATGSNPALTYQTLNAVVQLFPEAAKELLGAVQFKIVDVPALPTAPANQSQAGAMAKKGALIGGLLGLAVMLFYACTRSTILSTEAIAKRTSLTCLGEIEKIVFKKRKKSENPKITVNGSRLPYSFRETYRSIRTKLLIQCEKQDVKTLLVTSTYPGEGKTTTAFNVALSLANAGNSVVLVDCDLRKPSVYDSFGIEPGRYDILDVFQKKCNTKEVLKRYQDTHLKVIGAKYRIENAAELVDSTEMANLLQELRAMADYVVLDSPPLDMMSDASALVNHADGVIFVIRYNYGRTSSIIQAIETMAACRKPMLGYIFNGVEQSFVDSVYRYNSFGNGRFYGKYGSYGAYGRRYGYGDITEDVAKKSDKIAK